MASFSYLLLSRRADMGRIPTMANITVLQSKRKWDFRCVTECSLLLWGEEAGETVFEQNIWSFDLKGKTASRKKIYF